MSKIIAKLQGGLGNQLFILAAGLVKALELNCDFEVDVSEYHAHNPRQIAISRILKRNQISVSKESRTKNIFIESSPYRFDSNFKRIKPDTLMIGYFQSVKYFQGYFDFIRDSFFGNFEDFSRPTTIERIGLHMRRGDYLQQKTRHFHGLTSDQFFRNCADILRSIWGDLEIDIFSDSPELAKQMSSYISNSMPFFDLNMEPLEIMESLARRKYIIGSNSSFSWWASFVMPRKYGEVIFPVRWNNYFDVKELKLDSWIQL